MKKGNILYTIPYCQYGIINTTDICFHGAHSTVIEYHHIQESYLEGHCNAKMGLFVFFRMPEGVQVVIKHFSHVIFPPRWGVISR